MGNGSCRGLPAASIEECLEVFRVIFGLCVEPLQDLFGDIFGYIARPAFGSVESDDPHRAIELAAHQIGDDGFPVGLFFVDLAPAAAEVAEIVQYQVNIDVIGQGRGDRGRTRHDANSGLRYRAKISRPHGIANQCLNGTRRPSRGFPLITKSGEEASMAVNKPVGDQRPQGRRQETHSAQNHARRRQRLDQAQQEERRVHGGEEAGKGPEDRQKVQGRPARAVAVQSDEGDGGFSSPSVHPRPVSIGSYSPSHCSQK
jgi:hypothetical protein